MAELVIFLPQFSQYLTHFAALVKLELTVLLNAVMTGLCHYAWLKRPSICGFHDPYLLGVTELVSRKHLLCATCMGVPRILILAPSSPCHPLVCSGWPGGWSPAGALDVGSAGSQLPGPPLRTQAGRGQPTAPTWRSSRQATHPCSQGINCSQTRSVQSRHPIQSCLGRPRHPSS